MHEIHLRGVSFRTDLAREAYDLAMQQEEQKTEIEGVRQDEQERDGMTSSWIWIDDEKAGRKLGKQPGVYYTLEAPDLRSQDSSFLQQVTTEFATQFARFLKEAGIGADDSILLVGLGNWNVTADALGPLVIKHALITRHLYQLTPDAVQEGYRSVSALSPGVLGITGIETSEIVQGVVERSQPDAVIVFDALAARSLTRLNTTIQVTDTGIQPGSGVGNKRQALNRQTLGIPVIAVGMPTVVDATTIANDAIDFVLAHLNRELKGEKSNPLDPLNRPTVEDLERQQIAPRTRKHLMGMVGTLSFDEKRQLIAEVLQPLEQNLVVTPKEVDSFITYVAKLIANGVNCALHEAVTLDNVASHIH